MVGRSTMDASWSSTQLLQVMEGHAYTCQVTATGGQETGNFTLTVTSKYVLWYY